jgi:FkbM family methyltransferase
MSLISPSFFRLCVFLLVSMATHLHAHKHKRERKHERRQAKELARRHAEEDAYKNSFIKGACELTQSAYLLIEPHLEAEDISLYANELTFIKKFPFSSYRLVSVPSQGNFHINDVDDTIKNHLRNRLCWEPKNKTLISQYVKPGSIALDIGAHIGTHTVTMAKYVGKTGIVFAFEPNKNTYRELIYNLVANDCKNVYPIHAAIGKAKSIVDVIISHPNNEGGSYVINTQGGDDVAIQLPLDAFNLNNVSFIKIDVENMEADVLDGAVLTIMRNKPVMLIEIQGNGQRPVQLNEDTEKMMQVSIEKIRKLGYDLIHLENSADYLALPEDLKDCIEKENIPADQRLHSGDEFIEDIFEIHIPGLKGAYNPSLVDFEDGYLMAFRYDIYKEPIGLYLDDFYQYIGVILLDENFNPKSAWQPCVGNRTYDPRLLRVDDAIYMSFASPAPSDPNSNLSSRLNLCTIDYSESGVFVANRNALNVSFQKKWEKNWVLFNYGKNILLEYQIAPHVILQPCVFDGSCRELTFDQNENNTHDIKWPFGIIRGGTPALLVDGKYLGFFHSSQVDPHTKKYTYYVGAYTFLEAPPFTIDQISAAPFVHPDFYSTPKNAKTESQVIYPGGFVMKNDKICLCYGENDDAIKIMILDKKKLFASLRNIH